MEKKLSLKIAMIGSRGLPIIYGGIERHVAEVSTRLARFGHDVTVFGRRPYSRNAVIDGVKVRAIPAIHTKNLETATNSFLSTINACMGDFDIIHFHGVGPSIFSLFPWALRKKAVATIHAPDYRQSKWGPVARYFLKAGERNALRFCRASITVSKTMFNQLKNEAEYPIYYIPNGATIKSPVALEEAKKFGIEPGKYILAVHCRWFKLRTRLCTKVETPFERQGDIYWLCFRRIAGRAVLELSFLLSYFHPRGTSDIAHRSYELRKTCSCK